MDETVRGRGGTRTLVDGGSEDEAEAATTWRAYRATTFDTEETLSSGTAAGGNSTAQKGAKQSPAEVRSNKCMKLGFDLIFLKQSHGYTMLLFGLLPVPGVHA